MGLRGGQAGQPGAHGLNGGDLGEATAPALHGRSHHQPLPVLHALLGTCAVQLHHAAGRQQRHDVAHAQLHGLLDGPVHLLGRAEALRQAQSQTGRRLGGQGGLQRHGRRLRGGDLRTPASSLSVEDLDLVTDAAAQHPQQVVCGRLVQRQGIGRDRGGGLVGQGWQMDSRGHQIREATVGEGGGRRPNDSLPECHQEGWRISPARHRAFPCRQCK